MLPYHVLAYDTIVSFCALKGFAPTMTELASSLKMSPQGAKRLVDKLVEFGCLERVPKARRGIRPIKSPVTLNK